MGPVDGGDFTKSPKSVSFSSSSSSASKWASNANATLEASSFRSASDKVFDCSRVWQGEGRHCQSSVKAKR